MSTLVIVLAAIALVCFVVLGLLASPIEVAFDVDTTRTAPSRKVHARLSVLFGLVHIELARGARRDARHARAQPEEHDERQRRRRHPRDRRWRARAWRFTTSPGLFGRVRRFTGRTLRSLHARDVHVEAQVGLDDPADSGQMWGVLAPFTPMLTRRLPGVHVVPDFAEEALRVRGAGTFFIVPLELIALATLFALSPVTFRAMTRAMRA